MDLWVCGQGLAGKNDWFLIGVFNNKELATKACETEDYFIGKVPLNHAFLDKTIDLPESSYPLLSK